MTNRSSTTCHRTWSDDVIRWLAVIFSPRVTMQRNAPRFEEPSCRDVYPRFATSSTLASLTPADLFM